MKNRNNWEKELHTNLNMRMNLIVNDEENNNIHFSTTTKEIFRVQIFFDSFMDKFKELKRIARNILRREKGILNFDWPDEPTYAQQKLDYSMEIEQL